jgi:hypothetical protein
MTTQISERLILDGAVHAMSSRPPLPDASFLSETKSIVRYSLGDHVTTEIWRDRNGTRCQALGSTFTKSSACWRGYIGTWRLENTKLYLVGLEGRYRLNVAEPLFADWCTDVLRLQRGKRLRFAHKPGGLLTEEELLISIECGIEVDRSIFRNSIDAQ